MGRHGRSTRRVEFAIDPRVDPLGETAVLAMDHGRRTRRATVAIPREWGDAGAGSPLVSRTPAATDEGGHDLFVTHVIPEIDVLLRVARNLVARPADAEDLVQDTLVRAFRAIDSFDGRHPRAWLLTIMRNAQINRTRRRRPELLDDPYTAVDRLQEAEPDGGSPEAVVVGASFDAVVVEALDSLPGKFRQVMQLVDVDGLTYAEAAEVVGVPMGTVMSRLHRARKRIRDRLAAAGLAPRRGD